jgi:hypothetical protein
MSEKQKETQTVEIDGISHDIESFTDEQKVMLNHISDLTRKESNAVFHLDQLRVGLQAYVTALKEQLEKDG